MKLFLALLTACALAACSTQSPSGGNDTGVRRVAVNYSGAAEEPEISSTGREVTRHVVNRGTSVALGAAGLGWAGDILSLGVILKGPRNKTKGVTQEFRQQCLLGGVDPVYEATKAFERRLSRDRTYTIDANNPDATFTFRVMRADMDTVDSLGQTSRPLLTVRTTLANRSGKKLWERQSTAAGRAHTWREYGNNPSLFRTEVAAVSDAIARDLIAGLH